MNKKINVKKISQSVSFVFNKDTTKLHMNPYLDWGMVVALFFVLVFGVSIFSYSVFIDIYSEDAYILSEDIANNNYYNKDNENNFRTDISRLLNFYDRKQVKLDAMLHQGVPDTPDPAYAYWLDENNKEKKGEVEKEEVKAVEEQERLTQP